jgi:hypothetical protein
VLRKFQMDSAASSRLMANSKRRKGWFLLVLAVHTSTIIQVEPPNENILDIFGVTARAAF